MRKPLFYNFRPLILASKIDQQIMFFLSRFLHLLFLICLIVFKNGRFGDPLENPMGSKMVPKSAKWCHKSQISSPMNLRAHFLAFQILVRLRDPFLIDCWSTCAHLLEALWRHLVDLGCHFGAHRISKGVPKSTIFETNQKK